MDRTFVSIFSCFIGLFAIVFFAFIAIGQLTGCAGKKPEEKPRKKAALELLPQDQYPVAAYTASANGGQGNDWAVFRTNANGDGQTAIERQGSFFRMTRDRTPATVRETGYGIDGPPKSSINPS